MQHWLVKQQVLVKLFMESECGACDKYTATYVKQMLSHIGWMMMMSFFYSFQKQQYQNITSTHLRLSPLQRVPPGDALDPP